MDSPLRIRPHSDGEKARPGDLIHVVETDETWEVSQSGLNPIRSGMVTRPSTVGSVGSGWVNVLAPA